MPPAPIRPAGPADASALAALIRLAFAHQEAATDPPPGALAETADSVAAQLAAGGGAVAERDRALLAGVLWAEEAGGLHLGRLAVRPDCRRQGLARALVAAAEAEARRRGLACLNLGVRLVLPGNRRLFAACGFREVGTRAHPGYAAPTSVDMEKRLDGAG